MIHSTFRRLTLSLVAASGLVFAPTAPLTAVVDSTVTDNPWESQRSPSWLVNEDERYATDHILVKRVGQAVERVTIDSNVSEALAYWQQQDNVEYAEPDSLYH